MAHVTMSCVGVFLSGCNRKRNSLTISTEDEVGSQLDQGEAGTKFQTPVVMG